MSETLRVAVAQFAPGPSRDENLEGIRQLVTEAARSGAGLVVLPEYSAFFGGPMGAHWVAAAEPLDGPFVAGLADIARSNGIVVVAGMLETASRDDRFRNTIVALGADGALLSVTRKLHLYDAFGQTESDWAEPGDIVDAETFTVSGVPVGVQTCYDLRFPEVTRRLVDAGAELVLVPAEWVAGPDKRHAWRTLAAARAIENTVYLAAADHPPPVGVGASLIVDPLGRELAFIDDEVAVATASIDRAEVVRVRTVNPALSLRRFRVQPV
ncbi:carbon-nitrogen hydrolase family protein [Microcella sp.]|uniref:carbon-nitrogen hydrolase family protein n=1 Tax=Microcella sp. TaxID=1913979 RepID=UPI00391D1C82